MIGPRVKREFFTQLPNKLIDSDLSANAFKGFVRMLRDREIMSKEKFAGSIRKLANRIKMPPMTVSRMVTEWEKSALVYKEVQTKADENREEMVLYLLIDSLWIKNSETSRKECTKLGQCLHVTVPNWDNDVPDVDTDAPNRYGGVPNVSVNETTNTIGNTITDTGNNTNLERDARAHSSEDAIASQTPSLSFSELLAETDARIEHEFEDWLRATSLSSQSTMHITHMGKTDPLPFPDENPTEVPAHTNEVLIASPTVQPAQEQSEHDGKEHVEQTQLVTLPLTEPDMTGAWNHKTCARYSEWKNQKRYDDGMFSDQEKAAKWLHATYKDATLEQFKDVFDDWFKWWKENRGTDPMHVSDLKVKKKNGIVRFKDSLDRIEARKNAPSTNNIRHFPNRSSAIPSPTPEEYAEVSETERRQRENFEKNGGLARLEQLKAEKQAQLAARRA